MQTLRDLGQLRSALVALRAGGHTVALVPTMGALHAGHLALIEAAKDRADRVVATIFVNPLQFGAGEDLDRYPRQEKADARALEQAGCDLLWMPTADQMYPDGFATTVSVDGLSKRWEGTARPGHFDGVATVVTKLLTAVRPDIALFGEKDFQQLAVIRRLAADLNLGAEIVGAPTVRDADGLALSSRNAYLSDDDRARAVCLPRALERAAEEIADGAPVDHALDHARHALTDAGFSVVDYVALVDEATLEPVTEPAGQMRLIAAATIGGTRLIDNLAVRVSN
ncbi:pantoate--beta-alanine ligase [Sphingomonas sabuli]|uniref:Pantothenate synthetase n=1 Tax=Sphingomonas sabuli TaxID=2764186 RepID=A0A7G9L102_9SPHN|nr:pantoate--beta-alanine ligase [Sphingomonas sabuli]QNM82301.1 pantoate--beta-alanine ligase [Sphingomonas sabuli]